MRKIVLAIVLVFSPFVLVADDAAFCPLGQGLNWTYSHFSKKENKRKDNIPAYIGSTEEYSGYTYILYEAPTKKMKYLVAPGKKGIYAKAAKVSLPVLNFITADIEFVPAVTVMKFPIEKGDAWRYEGKVKAKAMFFVNAEQKVWCNFRVAGQEIVEAGGVTYNAWHIKAAVCRSWNDDKPFIGHAWMAENVGMVRGETPNSVMELISYKGKENGK